uniref:Uncharacterized protein n=1 Tax=Panagrolaimus sp. ES5 TaxID=591445 RepID=A0AC34G502_9BILA
MKCFNLLRYQSDSQARKKTTDEMELFKNLLQKESLVVQTLIQNLADLCTIEKDYILGLLNEANQPIPKPKPAATVKIVQTLLKNLADLCTIEKDYILGLLNEANQPIPKPKPPATVKSSPYNPPRLNIRVNKRPGTDDFDKPMLDEEVSEAKKSKKEEKKEESKAVEDEIIAEPKKEEKKEESKAVESTVDEIITPSIESQEEKKEESDAVENRDDKTL